LRREQQNMALRLIGAYVEALKAGDEVALAATQVNFYRRQLDATRKSFAAGAGTRTDAEEVEARLDLTLALQLQAQQAVGYAQRRLQVLIGLSATELAALNGARLLALQPDIGSLENWIARSEASSPEIAAATAQLVAASAEATRARAAHQPTVEAVGLWSRSDRDNVNAPGYRYTNRSVSVQLNVPLYSGGEIDSQVRQADAEREAASQNLQSLRLDVALRVHREFRGMADGTAKIRALEQALRSADQVVASTQKSYSAGSRSVIDVLNAEQQRASVVRDLAQSRCAYLMAYAGLLALVDGLDTDTLTRMNAWFGAVVNDPADTANRSVDLRRIRIAGLITHREIDRSRDEADPVDLAVDPIGSGGAVACR
jgi:TolC family type I secretion outer membrane protein